MFSFQQLDPEGHIERTTVIRVVTTDDDEYKVSSESLVHGCEALSPDVRMVDNARYPPDSLNRYPADKC